MSSPYSGATPAGAPQGYADPTQQNYAADYSGAIGAVGGPRGDGAL